MMVNGEPTLTCATYLESVLPGPSASSRCAGSR
jgi:hypothetical protein